MRNRKAKASETTCAVMARAAWFRTRALGLVIVACASPAYAQPLFQQQADRTGGIFATRSTEPKDLSVETLAPGNLPGSNPVADPGVQGPSASASVQPLNFEERFSYDLNDFWCENHLAVADFDRD